MTYEKVLEMLNGFKVEWGGVGGTSQLCRVGVSSAARQPVTGAAGRQRHTLFNEMWGKQR